MAINPFADKLIKKLFGTSSDVFLKRVKPIVQRINDLEPEMQKLTDEQLKEKTQEFKKRIAEGLSNITDKDERRKREQAILTEILPEAFATIREGSKRVTGPAPDFPATRFAQKLSGLLPTGVIAPRPVMTMRFIPNSSPVWIFDQRRYGVFDWLMRHYRTEPSARQTKGFALQMGSDG